MTGVSHMHDTWHSTATEFRAVVFNLSGDPGRNMSFMSQVWPQWDINDNFGSHSRVTAQCWYFPISGQTPVGTRGTSHCATWAQTAEKELWERQQDTRTIKAQSRIDLLTQRCSDARGFRRENGWVWAPEGGQQGGCSGSAVKPGSGVGQVASLSHWCGHSRWGQQPWDTLSWPSPSWRVKASKGPTGAEPGSKPQPDSSVIPTCPLF